MGTEAQQFLRDAAEKSADLVHREIIRKNVSPSRTVEATAAKRFFEQRGLHEMASALSAAGAVVVMP